MKIFIILEAGYEYTTERLSFSPCGAFSDKDNAQKLEKLTNDFYTETEIIETDVEPTTDTIWCVLAEEAYSSGNNRFVKAFATEEEAKKYADQINNDTNHTFSTYFNADVEDVVINKDLDGLKNEYDNYLKEKEEERERLRYKNKFSIGDKVRMFSLDEVLAMESVEQKTDEFGTKMIRNNAFHLPIWICLQGFLLEDMGKTFVIEKILGDCVMSPCGHFLQEWLFEKID